MDGGSPGHGLPRAAWRAAGGWRRLAAPRAAGPVERRNYELLQADSVVSGLIVAAMTFVPVYFVRAGATPFEVSLITTLPAIGGLVLAMPFGRLLEPSARKVTWWARSRLLTNAFYGALALVIAVVAPAWVIPACLVLILLATIPQTLTQVVFPLVMDGVAGPRGRYDLLGRRWALMGLATAVLTGLAGILLDALVFPLGYQLLFLAAGVSGIASWWLCGRLVLAAPAPRAPVAGTSSRDPAPGAAPDRRPFLGFVLRKGLYSGSLRMVAALLPLFYVRILDASDAWIGSLAMINAFATVIGYAWWRRAARRLGGRTVLLVSLAVAAAAPALVVATRSLELVVLLSIVGSFFGAGADLALFDELMGRIPRDRIATFSGLDSAATNLAGIVAPLLGAAVASFVGVEAGVLVGVVVGIAGLLLFVRAGAAGPVTPSAPPAGAAA